MTESNRTLPTASNASNPTRAIKPRAKIGIVVAFYSALGFAGSTTLRYLVQGVRHAVHSCGVDQKQP